MSNKASAALTRFREHMGGFFHDMFRASGLTMTDPAGAERVRSIGERMARTMEVAAEAKAIEVIKLLQAAVLVSFTKVEERLDEYSKRLLVVDGMIGGILDAMKAQAQTIEELDEKVAELSRRVRRDSEDREWQE